MGYSQVALENRILDMYPQIREKGTSPERPPCARPPSAAGTRLTRPPFCDTQKV